LQGLKNLLTFYRDSTNEYIIVCQLLREEDEENLQPDGIRVLLYILVSCAVAAMSSSAVMVNSRDKTKTGIYEVESENPFVTAKEGRRTFTVVSHYSDAHACDQKLRTDVVAVESYKREDTNKSN
jgi:hypothetical protein